MDALRSRPRYVQDLLRPWFYGFVAFVVTASLGFAQEVKPAQYSGNAGTKRRPDAVGNAKPAPKQSGGSPSGAPQAEKSVPQAKRIWSDPNSPGGNKPGDCYFRRVMELPDTERAYVEIFSPSGADVYFNGRRIRTVRPGSERERIEILGLARPGKNCLAVRVPDAKNTESGLRAEFYFKPLRANWRVVVTDAEWLATKNTVASWQMVGLNDEAWVPAIDLDETGSGLNLGPETAIASNPTSEPAPREGAGDEKAVTRAPLNTESSDRLPRRDAGGGSDVGSASPKAGRNPKTGKTIAVNEALRNRFTTVPGFSIDEVAGPSVGSLLALSFNEFGHILVSVEGGGLLLLYDSDGDNVPDKTRSYCDLVQNVQGILPLNGDVYVTGEGDQGTGLYRLVDEDRNGETEKAELLTRFEGIPGEHGVHQIVLGPDGFLYITLGNQVQVERSAKVNHSYAKPYEGDLVQPRFEDPGGHASGVKAPGGMVVRYDMNDRTVSIVAGGLRNAYDLAFHPNGSLYLHDSDMEADIGAVWHRPTGLFRIVEGGEYGWRSGWANWPDYYLDRFPSLADTGRGSPTGIAIYNHHHFPIRYHRAIFTADWSEGRIIALPIESIERGQVKAEDFVIGTPMNVTDLEVGPDGSLYFCTGGRGTEGGIYRVRWNGEVPESQRNLGNGITRAVRQPQLYSAFGRQAVAILKREVGEEWEDQILGVVFSEENPARYRIQALDLMQLLGPAPSVEMLIELSKTSNEQVRAKSARLLGLHPDNEDGLERLQSLVSDASPMVRIAACESLIRSGAVCDISAIESLLVSDAREDRFFGRRLLMNIPAEQWKAKLLKSKTRTVVQSSLALVAASSNPEDPMEAVTALLRISQGFVSDADFLDLLRVMQVALKAGPVSPDAVPELKAFVQREFPTGNATLNGELVRIATYLQCDIVPQCVEYLKMDVSMSDRMLIAMHLPMMPHEWTSAERMAILQFFETCLKEKSGSSYPLYVMKSSEAISNHLTEREALQILELGQKYPNAALAALFKINSALTDEQIELLMRLDSTIDKGGLEDDVYKRLKTGITAILSQQESELANDYLQQRWRKSPDRRASIALAFAQKPNEANWDYLVRSIAVLDLFAIPDVCKALQQIDAVTDDADVIRQTILQGCRLVEANQDPSPILQLLEYWTEQKPLADTLANHSPMEPWQAWFAQRYPESPPATPPSEKDPPRWSLDFLDQFLNGEQGREGSAVLGAAVYAKARCSACHKMNSQGGGLGPDLTSINRRFTRSEVLESILFPSHVISDQYASKKVVTRDGEVYSGIAVKTSRGLSIRVNENKEFLILDEEIDEIAPSKVSAMPAGLLDDLTPTEIRDLMCYLGYIPEEKKAAEKPSTIRR